MEPILEFLRSLHGEHLKDLIQAGGFALLFTIVFAETGLLAGFFLPGDSLLFVAGFLVGSGKLLPPSPLPQDPLSGMILLNVLLMTAAFLGNTTGYWVGAKAGRKLFDRPNSRFFKKEHLIKTQEFYDQHGGKTIIMAEFMPFARTFAPVVAGIAKMPYARFMSFNLIGVVVWIFSMTLLGSLLGGMPLVQKHFEKVVILIILLSVSPAIIHFLKARKGKH
jgi:membrane-associated protein